MPAAEKQLCKKCGKMKSAKFFYKDPTSDGKYPICIDCLTMYIDNYDPNTFTWILKEFDLPYIRKIWMKIANEEYAKNPAKFSGKSVLGKYMRMMHINQYKKYHYADSEALNKEEPPVDKKECEESIKEKFKSESGKSLKERYEDGEICEAQYLTLCADNIPEREFQYDENNRPPDLNQEEEKETESSQEVEEEEQEISSIHAPVQTIDEAAIRNQLTDEEYQYLIFKWGYLYKPSQLVQMEQLYEKYANEYEMNVDREDTLKKICKTSLKMDEALDIGDTQSYQKLASVSDQLRKSGKFTEAQNKEQQTRYLDSVSEFVALCEREGGPIKDFVDPDEYPQDKVDFTLKDLKSYTYNLAVNELNLGNLIESYIAKLEKAEEEGEDNISSGLITSAEEEENEALSDEEAIRYQEYLEDEIEKDAEMLLSELGGENE